MSEDSPRAARKDDAPDDSGEVRASLAALALAARDGDDGAASELWRRSRTMLTRLALGFGIAPDDVPGVVQDTMLAGHQHLARFDPTLGSFEAWIGTILLRQARNRTRSTRRYRSMLGRLADRLSRRSSADGGDDLVARLTVRRLLASLTDRQREVVALFYIAELGAGEVARILGLTESGVRSIARQAREKLSRIGGDRGRGANREDR